MPKERSTISTADRETAAVPVREVAWQGPSWLASLMGKALDLRAAASGQYRTKESEVTHPENKCTNLASFICTLH